MVDPNREKPNTLLLTVGLNRHNLDYGKSASKAESLTLRSIPLPLCCGLVKLRMSKTCGDLISSASKNGKMREVRVLRCRRVVRATRARQYMMRHRQYMDDMGNIWLDTGCNKSRQYALCLCSVRFRGTLRDTHQATRYSTQGKLGWINTSAQQTTIASLPCNM